MFIFQVEQVQDKKGQVRLENEPDVLPDQATFDSNSTDYYKRIMSIIPYIGYMCDCLKLQIEPVGSSPFQLGS